MIEDDSDFVDSIITGDESWFFTFDPLTKWQSTTRVGTKSPRAQKLCFQKLKIKTMLILFFDSKGVVEKACFRRPNSHERILLRGFGLLAEANCMCETRGIEESPFHSPPQ